LRHYLSPEGFELLEKVDGVLEPLPDGLVVDVDEP
jgi:hypothetical protein